MLDVEVTQFYSSSKKTKNSSFISTDDSTKSQIENNQKKVNSGLGKVMLHGAVITVVTLSINGSIFPVNIPSTTIYQSSLKKSVAKTIKQENSAKTLGINSIVLKSFSNEEKGSEKQMFNLMKDIRHSENQMFVAGIAFALLFILAPLFSNVSFMSSSVAALFGLSATIPKVRRWLDR